MGDFHELLVRALSFSPLSFVFGLAAFVLILTHVLYQLMFHPLAKYPGPLLAKLTMMRATYHAWKGDGHIDIWQLHREYGILDLNTSIPENASANPKDLGPIVRYGPNWILFNSEQGYKDIYGAKQNTGKHHRFSQFNPRASNLFTIHDKKEHSRRRRCIGKSFSDVGVRKFEGKLMSHIDKFCNQIGTMQKKIAGEWGEPLRMSDWVGYFIFDTLTDFVLNRNYNLIHSSKDRPIIHHIQEHILRPAVCSYMPFLALLKVDKVLFKKATQSTRTFWRFIKRAIAKRSRKYEDLTDVFTQIERSRQPELCSMGIQSETGMFIVAGLDTTTAALCALLFYLSRNQLSYERLCLEVRNTFEKEEDIRLGKQLRSCIFLRACIDETLRMSPPVGSSPWREVGPGGETIAGQFIPQSCSVGTGIYSMHHNDAFFENAHEFSPERWLPEHNAESATEKAGKPAFMPFSTGPRSCIGRSLANAEVSLTIAVLLWRFDFRTSSQLNHKVGGGKAMQMKGTAGRANPAEFQLVDWVVGRPEGPMLEFRRRNVSKV